MSRRILVLSGHPNGQSFAAALANAYGDAAQQAGAEIRRHDLSAMAFDPDLPTGYKTTPPLEADLQAFWDDLVWSQHFVLVHPLWWGGMPARLKGVFDRVLLPGTAFRYRKGNPMPEKLLKGRSARLVLTSDTPDWFFRLAYGAAYLRQARGQVLGMVGFAPLRFSHIAPLHGSTPEFRQKALADLARLGTREATSGGVRPNRAPQPAEKWA